jgi:hypothetical protein
LGINGSYTWITPVGRKCEENPPRAGRGDRTAITGEPTKDCSDVKPRHKIRAIRHRAKHVPAQDERRRAVSVVAAPQAHLRTAPTPLTSSSPYRPNRLLGECVWTVFRLAPLALVIRTSARRMMNRRNDPRKSRRTTRRADGPSDALVARRHPRAVDWRIYPLHPTKKRSKRGWTLTFSHPAKPMPQTLLPRPNALRLSARSAAGGSKHRLSYLLPSYHRSRCLSSRAIEHAQATLPI